MIESLPGTLPRRFLRTVISTYGSSLLGSLIALVMTPILARSLGPQAYGVWVLVAGLALYGDFLQLGLVAAAINYITQSLAHRDREQLRRVVSTTFYLLVVLALLALAIGGAFSLLFSHMFSLPSGLPRQAAILMFLTTATVSLSLLGDTFVAQLGALQRYDLLNATLTLLFVSQAIAWAVAILLSGGLVALGIGSACATVLLLATRFWLVRRLMPEARISRRLVDRRLARGLGSLSGWLAAGQGAGIVIFQLDTLVVGFVVGVKAAGVYAIGQKLALIVDRLARPALGGFFTHGAELSAQGDQRSLARALIAGSRISLAIAAPVALALALFARPAIHIWVGGRYSGAADVVIYLALANVIQAYGRAGFLLLEGAGRARGPALISGLEAALNLTLSVVLGLEFGLTGVALATLLASVIVRLGLFVPYMARSFGVSIVRLVQAAARAHLCPALAAAALGLAVRSLSLPDAAAFFAGGGVVVTTYAAVFVLTGLSAGERTRMRQAARGFGARLRTLGA